MVIVLENSIFFFVMLFIIYFGFFYLVFDDEKWVEGKVKIFGEIKGGLCFVRNSF